MSGYAVFQAYNGEASEQLCNYMPDLDLLILNTEGTGEDTPDLVQRVRRAHPGLPVLHIGKAPISGMPTDVRNLPETFTVADLVTTVVELVSPQEK